MMAGVQTYVVHTYRRIYRINTLILIPLSALEVKGGEVSKCSHSDVKSVTRVDSKQLVVGW